MLNRLHWRLPCGRAHSATWECILQHESTFCSMRVHSETWECILRHESAFCNMRAHSATWEAFRDMRAHSATWERIPQHESAFCDMRAAAKTASCLNRNPGRPRKSTRTTRTYWTLLIVKTLGSIINPCPLESFSLWHLLASKLSKSSTVGNTQVIVTFFSFLTKLCVEPKNKMSAGEKMAMEWKCYISKPTISLPNIHTMAENQF